ncbi:hypothetical protein L6164_031690 [Bauhinia variegata]|uniref:Uncharacterized protein n=1 Tax=Bauhinia variegata TaxID=167791 RepID=A0ACB9LG88_BAUVA|nr:hypothetical protein L6164_031690 [Bauhinia variegata]
MELRVSSTLFFLLLLAFPFQFSSSSSTKGFSLSVENPDDVILSPNGIFTAGFYAVGENAYCFSIWFTEPKAQNLTVVWMANLNQPVNGRLSTLSIDETGNLILTDARQFKIWTTDTSSSSLLKLVLNNNGNLVLHEKQGTVLWQSFDHPINTLLPGQVLPKDASLVSSRSETNHSSGFYKLFFDDFNVLRLAFDGQDVPSNYWPDPWLKNFESGRSSYNGSRNVVLDALGYFSSSDNFTFKTSDYGRVLQRRLMIDYDGNLRVYSRESAADYWYVSWQAKSEPCKIHGICGPNSMCSNDPYSGRKCSCLPGYKVKNESDWSYGCEAKFNISCNMNESRFQLISHVEFYGTDFVYLQNSTFKQCQEICLQLCNCKGFQYNFRKEFNRYDCYTKTMLVNGYQSPDFFGAMFLRLPKGDSFSGDLKESVNSCHNNVNSVMLERGYIERRENTLVKIFLWLAYAIGGIEIFCLFMVWSCLMITGKKSSVNEQGYQLNAIGFRRFSYSELKKATNGFCEEIGRGGGGIVYKAVLSDNRVAAVKRLSEANQGESEFLAEVSIIGRLNHMNLIEMWGYCVERKHRLLVYEYMENGSLAQNLMSNTLNWSERYNIALGIARGLSYLHEECLEWILHCDVKPHNILLDLNYHPKIADFGLSKLQNRNDINSSFSRVRGTRGYMAPEWIFNLPITSKVDVYSYGIVMLEMITGKNPSMGIQVADGAEAHQGRLRRLVTWVREKKIKGLEMTSWVEEIMDPLVEGDYDIKKMETLVKVSLECVQEEKSARPTMSQVVEMLQRY